MSVDKTVRMVHPNGVAVRVDRGKVAELTRRGFTEVEPPKPAPRRSRKK